ncbi:hypothetical protein D3C77_351650 [compost metagenome]
MVELDHIILQVGLTLALSAGVRLLFLQRLLQETLVIARISTLSSHAIIVKMLPNLKPSTYSETTMLLGFTMFNKIEGIANV